jgi:hypothetical protein
VVLAVAVPPEPVQVKLYVLFWLRAPLEILPLVGSLPLQAPDAVQAVALVEAHVIVLDWPEATDVGEALRATVGGRVTTLGPKKLVTSA